MTTLQAETVKKGLLTTIVSIREDERAIVWKNRRFEKVLASGEYSYFDPFGNYRIRVFSRLTPWLDIAELPSLVKSDALPKDEVTVLNLASNQRALVWLDGRFDSALTPGLYAWWNGMVDVKYRVVDIRDNDGLIEDDEIDAVVAALEKQGLVTSFAVQPGSTVAFYNKGNLVRLLSPGRYSWWKDAVGNQFFPLDLREQTVEIGGQDMLTADKLALRLNVSVSFRIVDAVLSLSSSTDAEKALYREAQLLLRSQVGARDLDALLADKESLSTEMEQALRTRAKAYGLEVTSVGVKDIILPGEIKTILNRVVEAKKASEAATIVRREETAAMRHQLNSANLMAENPVLMRLRELETLEKVAASSQLKVILGEEGLAKKVASLV